MNNDIMKWTTNDDATIDGLCHPCKGKDINFCYIYILDVGEIFMVETEMKLNVRES